MEEGLLAKTGKNLEHWIGVVKETNLEKHKEIINFLKTNHDFTHGYANFVALKARKSDAGSFDDSELITNQYKGKDALLPIYKELLSTINSFGSDIIKTPKKDSVSLIRKRQFALIKPATKTRVDLGLKIKDQEPSGRLETSGPFGAMCTHRIQLTSVDDINQEVIDWLKMAYEKSV